MNKRTKQKAAPESGNFRKLVLLTVTILVALATVQVFRSATKHPDPNFIAAQKLVNDYERGREQVDRNYRHAVYRQALSNLKRVNPRSVSADAATALRVNIERGRARFEERGKSLRKSRVAATGDRRVRADALAASHISTEIGPPPTFPECEHEKSTDNAEP